MDSIICNMTAAKEHVVEAERGIYTVKERTLGGIDCWYMPKGIANILQMHELKQLYHITYDSSDGYYVIHHPKGPVHFKKDHLGLPYIDLGD